MNYKLALWAAVGLLAVGCAQQQVSQGGAADFEPLPVRDTVLNESILPSANLKRSLGKPIPGSSGHVAPAEANSSSPGPELLRERKRYEAVAL
jgi:hypothetical protein